MKRKQKRFLQMTLLFLVTLIFLPNIGLWSLYKEKHFMKSTGLGEQQILPVRFGDGQLYTWTDGLKRKDWHDYERIQKDAMRLGTQGGVQGISEVHWTGCGFFNSEGHIICYSGNQTNRKREAGFILH